MKTLLSLAALSLASLASLASAQILSGPPCKPGPGVTCGLDLTPMPLMQSGIVSFRR